MITKYLDKALERASYELLEDGSFCATVRGLRGVIALGQSLEECRRELAEVVEEWVLVRVARGLAIPRLGGVTIKVRRAG
jgi:predicted RNase H-like HicB family nuclease